MTYQDDGYGYPEGYGAPRPQDPAPGRGRRRAAEGGQGPGTPGDPGRPGAPRREQADPQWEQSGLGWEQQAWRRTQLEASAQTFLDPSRRPAPPDQAYPDAYRPAPGRPGPGYQDPGYQDPGYRDPGHPESEYREPQYQEPGYQEPGYQGSEYRGTDPREPGYDPGRPGGEFDDGYGYDAGAPAARIPAQPGPGPAGRFPTPASAAGPDPISTPAPAPAPPGVSAAQPGRGAFGAAGLAVVFGIAAIAAVPVLAIAVALGQIGVAVGWLRTAGFPAARRTMAIAALTGIAATVLTYRSSAGDAPGAGAGALGVGFVALIADQLLLRRRSGPGAPAGHALAAAVSAAFLCVLPVGYLAAARTDSQVTAACALAAAAAVLCCALLGGPGRAPGLLGGVVAAGAVGALTAMSLSAASGTSGGLLGGLAAGVFGLIGVAVTDRLGREGGDITISAQALPTAFAACAALLVPALLRI
jgi:hypothetical protein